MTNETKQTAIDWYINMSKTLYKQFVSKWITLEVYNECRTKLKKQAQKIEQNQMIEFATWLLSGSMSNECAKDYAEHYYKQYYNETYGGNK